MESLRSSGYNVLGNLSLSVLGQMQALCNPHSTPPNPVSSKKQLFQSELAISEARTEQKLCEEAGTSELQSLLHSPYLTPPVRTLILHHEKMRIRTRKKVLSKFIYRSQPSHLRTRKDAHSSVPSDTRSKRLHTGN